MENRNVIQPRRSGRRRSAQALPGVQPDVVMVAACRDERRLRVVPLRQLEAEYVALNPQLRPRPLEVIAFGPQRRVRFGSKLDGHPFDLGILTLDCFL